MPLSSKRASSPSSPASSAGGASGSAKKQKLDGSAAEAGEEDTATSDAAAVSPIAEPNPAPSDSARVETEEEEPKSGDHKTILQVLANMKENPTRVDVVEYSFGLLKRLIQSNKDEDLMKCIVDANGISVVTTIVKNNPKEEALQMEGRALLDLLCKTVKKKPEMKGIEAVLCTMKTLPRDAALQTKCCDILWNAANSGLHEFIGEAGGIPLIVVALKNHRKEEGVLEQGLAALVNLTFHSSSNCKRVADVGGIAVVVDTLNKHSKNIKVHNGVIVLQNLSAYEYSAERRKSVMQAAGHTAVITFMKDHPQSALTQECGCAVLSHLALDYFNGERKALVDAGAIPVVVKAMKKHPNNVDVQHRACSFLNNFSFMNNPSEGGRDILGAMNEAGAVTALSAAIVTHSKHKNIRKSAKEAWNRLVDSLPCG